MEKFDFDQIIDRRGTDCNKWDGRNGPIDPDCLQFTIADMDFPSPVCIQEALQKRVQHPIYGYTHAGAELNTAVAGWLKRRHGAQVEPAWIKPSTGILTGLSFALRAVTKPGDKVMVFTPVYNPFFHIIEGAGCVLVECPLKKENGAYSIDYGAAEEQMRGGVKAILFCNPHNPVGRVWTREELSRLADLCVEHNVYFLSDEAHADFGLFGNSYTPLCTLPQMRALGVSCVSPNKTFNVPGISIAFLIIPDKEVYQAASDAQRGVWITAPPIMSMVAAQAGYNGADAWMDAVNAYIEENSRLVQSCMAEQMPKIRIAPHEGTYLLWLDISCFGISAQSAAKEMAETCGVQLSSGHVYRGDGGSHLRFNIAAPRQLLGRALERMLPMYRKYCPEG